MSFPIPENEEERLASLDGLRIDFANPVEEVQRLCALASEIAETPIALVSLVMATEQRFIANVGLEGCEGTSREDAFCAHAIMSDKQLVVPDATADPRFANNPLVTGDPSIRLYAGTVLQPDEGQGVGTLCVIDRKPRVLSDKVLGQLDTIGKAVSALLAGHRDKLRLLELVEEKRASAEAFRAAAETDPLTQVLNSAAFWLRVNTAVSANKTGAIFVIDVDHFKDVNDSYGHPAGDAFLRVLAGALTKVLPGDALIARLGGDEFGAYLPMKARQGELETIAGALRGEVREAAGRLSPPLSGALSIGIARHPVDGLEAGLLYRRADAALYTVKSAGRDGFRLFEAGEIAEMPASGAGAPDTSTDGYPT